MADAIRPGSGDSDSLRDYIRMVLKDEGEAALRPAKGLNNVTSPSAEELLNWEETDAANDNPEWFWPKEKRDAAKDAANKKKQATPFAYAGGEHDDTSNTNPPPRIRRK